MPTDPSRLSPFLLDAGNPAVRAAMVNMRERWHRWADVGDPAADCLESQAAPGPVQIIAVESGTGVKWALVGLVDPRVLEAARAAFAAARPAKLPQAAPPESTQVCMLAVVGIDQDGCYVVQETTFNIPGTILQAPPGPERRVMMCAQPCPPCQEGTTPARLRVTFSGITNWGRCENCQAFNGQFDLDQDPELPCLYKHFFDPPPCSPGDHIVGSFSTTGLQVVLTIGAEGASWVKNYTMPIDCSTVDDDLTLAWANENLGCNVQNATCHVSVP